MKHKLIFATINIGLLFTFTVKGQNPDEFSAIKNPKWQLIWQDEFSINGKPDPEKWDYEIGFIRNNEEQYYTDRPENVKVENGNLVITAIQENFKNPSYDATSTDWKKNREFAKYTSACVITLGKAHWEVERVEVRAKIPNFTGSWPAIWMLGINRTEIGWPRCGEIDIMEHVGKMPNFLHATVHRSQDGKHRAMGKKISVEKIDENFHIYAVEKAGDNFNFFYNDQLYFTYPMKTETDDIDIFYKKFYLLINFAIGGSWGGKNIDNSAFPSEYLIDYVRVYKAVEEQK